MFALAGHGIQLDGRQTILINEFDKRSGFYKMWSIETNIRNWASRNTNTYIIGLFACCREIFSTKRHCGLFGGTEQQACVHFDMVQFTKLQAGLAKDGNSKAEALKVLNKFLTDHAEQLGSIEDLKIELGKLTTQSSLIAD